MSEDAAPESDRAPGAPHPRETLRLFGQNRAEADFLEAFNGFDFFLVTLFLFTIIYIGSNWFHWHWHKPNDSKYEKELLNLRHQIKEMEIQHDVNQFKTDDVGYKTVMQRIESILGSPDSK